MTDTTLSKFLHTIQHSLSTDRRGFIGTILAGGLGSLLPGTLRKPGAATSPVPDSGQEESGHTSSTARQMQRLSPDAQTDPSGVEYFFLGNGEMTAVIQHASGKALEMGQTPLGLMFWNPFHFTRKWSTFPFHPEWGLERGLISISADDKSFRPDPSTLHVSREYPDGIPTVLATWKAGDDYTITERFWMDSDDPILYREVTAQNNSSQSRRCKLSTANYYNHILFTDFRSDEESGVLRAKGLAEMHLFSDAPSSISDRYISVDYGTIAGDSESTVRLIYTIGAKKDEVLAEPPTARWQRTKRYWQGYTSLDMGVDSLNGLYRASRDGLRAAVSSAGRFDASIWQYNMEWVMDSYGVIRAAAQTGQFSLAASVLHNCLTRLTNEKGICAHASRFRDNLDTELNQQGALLGAAWTYYAWSGDIGLIRRLWPQIKKVAEFPLTDRYLHKSGLLYSTIEFFERTGNMGVQPGFAISHQSLVAWGLEKAAQLAEQVRDVHSAKRWRAAGTRMREAMLHHPQFALVEDNVIIKRRLTDGSRQKILRVEERDPRHIPDESPLAREKDPLLDPCVSTLFPILHRQIDPNGSLASNTLDTIQTLWREEQGGYLRYHHSSDPDAPGGWTFPTAMVGRAMAMAGRTEHTQEVLNWFRSIQGARGGSYFEIYADHPRPVPPFPPMGIVVWGWAEIASLYIEGILGAHPTSDGASLQLSPNLPEEINTLSGELIFRDSSIRLDISRTRGKARASFNGQTLPYTGEGVTLPTPVQDGNLRIEV